MTIDVAYLFDNYHERERQWLTARISNPADADDVLSTAYLRATQFLSDAPDVTYPSTWFRSIVRNCWVDFIRYCNRQKRPDRFCVELTPEIVTVPGPDNRNGRVAKEHVAQLLNTSGLSDDERVVVVMRLQGYTTGEIASQLSMSFVVVHALHAQAIERMKVAAWSINYDRA